jgi:phosphoenolpyruvate carboxykinase (ATP)
MTETFNLLDYGINPKEVIRNAAPAKLYALAVKYEPEAEITSSGALSLKSGSKTGRSPKDKRIIERSESVNDIWWGNVNIKMDEHTFDINR